MNVAEKLLGRLGSEEREEGLDEAAEAQKRRTIPFARHQHLIGLGRVKFPSNGQMRRARIRTARTDERHATRRHHAAWFRNEQAYARLRGQIFALDNPSLFDPAVIESIRSAIEDRYTAAGKPGIENARELLAELEAERVARAKRMEAQAAAHEAAQA